MDAASITAIGVIFTGLVGLFLKNDATNRKFQAEENKKSNAAYIAISKALDKNTKATVNADKYLRERNGRDIEKHTELLNATKEIPTVMQRIADEQASAIVKALKIDKQTVKEQTVKHQTAQSTD